MSDPVLLFRYSALTFNGHRIHYDRDYVTKVEGYPGLIFHGPLQAALIIEMAAKLRGGKAPKKFTYRGLQPLFEGTEFSINANDNSENMAASDSLVQQMLGHGIAAKLSQRLGEGVLNGLLTARLGLAAIDVTRPLPFAALPPPKLSDLATDLLRKKDEEE